MADEIVATDKAISRVITETKKHVSGKAVLVLTEGTWTLGGKKNAAAFAALKGVGGGDLVGTVLPGKVWNITITIEGEEVNA